MAVSSSFLSCLNHEQVIRNVHDAARKCLRVCVVGTDGPLDVRVTNTASEPVPVTVVSGSLSITPREYTSDATFAAAALSDSGYTEVFSYTAVEDWNIGAIKVKSDTYGIYRIKIDGVIKDYFRTSEMNNNCIFEFYNPLALDTAEELTVEFFPYRLRLTSYDFFLRIEAIL